MTELPPSGAGSFARDFADVWRAYEQLGEESAKAGPLDARTRRLIKLALAIGANSEGAVHSHVRRAQEEGQSTEELRQVAILAITTLGFPAAMAAFSWINDILDTSSAPCSAEKAKPQSLLRPLDLTPDGSPRGRPAASFPKAWCGRPPAARPPLPPGRRYAPARARSAGARPPRALRQAW